MKPAGYCIIGSSPARRCCGRRNRISGMRTFSRVSERRKRQLVWMGQFLQLELKKRDGAPGAVQNAVNAHVNSVLLVFVKRGLVNIRRDCFSYKRINVLVCVHTDICFHSRGPKRFVVGLVKNGIICPRSSICICSGTNECFWMREYFAQFIYFFGFIRDCVFWNFFYFAVHHSFHLKRIILRIGQHAVVGIMIILVNILCSNILYYI